MTNLKLEMGQLSSSAKSSSPRDRAFRALRATFIADAAQMPTHWIYSGTDLEALLKNHLEEPEFHPVPSCPFYDSKKNPGHYNFGDPSCYGEESLALVDFLERNKGELVTGEAWAQHLRDWSRDYGGRKNHATTEFDEKAKELGNEPLYPAAGADDAQANAFWKVAPVATRYVGMPEYLEKVELAIRAHQNNEDSVGFGLAFARMLSSACETPGISMTDTIKAGLKDSTPAAVEGIHSAFSKAIKSSDEGSHEAFMDFLDSYSASLLVEGDHSGYRGIKGKTCGFPQSFVVGLKICLDTEVMALANGERFDAFSFAIRRNLRAGGDTCGRSALIAGLVSAVFNEAPKDWAEKTNILQKIENFGRITDVK